MADVEEDDDPNDSNFIPEFCDSESDVDDDIIEHCIPPLNTYLIVYLWEYCSQGVGGQ